MGNIIKFSVTTLLAFSFITLSITGCASYKPPQVYNFDKERIYPKPFDEVWQKAIEWFGTKGTPVKNLDKASGFISTEYRLNTDDLDPEKSHFLCDCGNPGSAGIADQRIQNANGSFNIIVKKIDEHNTKVIINTFYKADLYMHEYGSGNPDHFLKTIDCNSTGRLEKELIDYLGN